MLRREPPAGLEAPSTGGAGLGITATLWKENMEHVKIGGKRKKWSLNHFFFFFVFLFRPMRSTHKIIQESVSTLCPDDYFQNLLLIISLCSASYEFIRLLQGIHGKFLT